MKKIISALLLLFAMIISTQSFAQHDKKGHAHEAGPHGGTVETASEGYHIEMLIKDAKIQFFILDANSKTVKDKNIKGELMIQSADGTTNTVALTQSGEGFVTADAKALKFSNLIVSFQVGKKTVSSKFKASSPAAKAPHKH